jgi:TPR repeat protein
MTRQRKVLLSILWFICFTTFGYPLSLKQEALRGDTGAQIRLAFNYMNQTPSDWVQSKFWFQMASDRNHPTPCFWLGHIFQHGLGTPINLAKSIYFYEKGASLKSTDCSKALALLYNKQMRFIDANAWKIIHLDSTKDLSGDSILTTIASLDSFEKEEARLLAAEIKSSWLIQNESTILDPTTKAPKFRSITLSNGNDYKGYIFKGIPNGYGMVKSNGGETYFGYFKNGRMHGPGQQFSSDGKIIFKGHWSNGIPFTR